MSRLCRSLFLVAVLAALPALADYDAGVMAYSRGDFAAARAEWEPLAEEGHARSQLQLGSMYANGHGVVINLPKAFEYFLAAAEQGLGEAQHAVAFSYRVGNGVPRNQDEAAKWYLLAADAGVKDAQYHLATFYGGGNGVPRDYVLSYKWFSLAAAQGVYEARPALFNCVDRLTPEQVAEAQRLASAWRPRQ